MAIPEGFDAWPDLERRASLNFGVLHGSIAIRLCKGAMEVVVLSMGCAPQVSAQVSFSVAFMRPSLERDIR